MKNTIYLLSLLWPILAGTVKAVGKLLKWMGVATVVLFMLMVTG